MTPPATHRQEKVYTLALAFERAKFAPRTHHEGGGSIADCYTRATDRIERKAKGEDRKDFLIRRFAGMRHRRQVVKDRPINAGLTPADAL
ncbi:hypothetical protein GCM10009504_21600 [Pseudomonas laurentiana]|nr:hypothetical protein GCM10009504_21600 [Pseudomonas laurentiana]